MKKALLYNVFTAVLAVNTLHLYAQSFSMKSVVSYPFPRDITSAAKGTRIAVTMQQEGRRNVYVAEGPVYDLHKLTNYTKDDGQEISSLSVSADGQWVVYVKGGEHSGNRDRSVVVNPAHDPVQPKIEVWSVKFVGGVPKKLGEGDYAVPSPKSDRVAWVNEDKIWMAKIDGSSAAVCVVDLKGECGSIQWSPDGSQFAFVCNRTDHTYIGVYTNTATPINWIAPSFGRDASPRWSPDGKKLAFIRTPGQVANANQGAQGTTGQTAGNRGGAQQWAIWTADVVTGKGTMLWKATETPSGGLPGTDGGANLYWAANRIVFSSYQDGWPHMYSVNPDGGNLCC